MNRRDYGSEMSDWDLVVWISIALMLWLCDTLAWVTDA